MSFDPTDAIEEVLGVRAKLGFQPADSKYLCPFVGKACTKRSTADKSNPYPVCSLRKSGGHVVAVCPKRFHERDFLKDVIEHAWTGPKPANPVIASEVKMAGFGNVDFVISEVAEDGSISQFLSVELQAIDITGSARPAYEGILEGRMLSKRPTYNFNWKNVAKRYMNQLISKGYYHHHWGTKIVAVIQDEVYDYFRKDANFFTTSDLSDPQVNIVFMIYAFENGGTDGREKRLVLQRMEGTHHSNLQQAVLYKTAPDKAAFISRIKKAMARA
jgi:Restriction endonuclease NotI